MNTLIRFAKLRRGVVNCDGRGPCCVGGFCVDAIGTYPSIRHTLRYIGYFVIWTIPISCCCSTIIGILPPICGGGGGRSNCVVIISW
jgi:hypothetical protein